MRHNDLCFSGGRPHGTERPRRPPINIGARPRLVKRSAARPSACKHVLGRSRAPAAGLRGYPRAKKTASPSRTKTAISAAWCRRSASITTVETFPSRTHTTLGGAPCTKLSW